MGINLPPTLIVSRSALGGTQTFTETLLDVAVPYIAYESRGLVGYCRPDAEWYKGGKLVNRLNPAQSFAAPGATNAVPVTPAAVNGYDVLSPRVAGTPILVPNTDEMAAGTAAGFFFAVLRCVASQPTSWLCSQVNSAGFTASDLQPAITVQASSTTQLSQLWKGSGASRAAEGTTIADLDTGDGLFRQVLWTWGPTGIRYFVDGVQRTLATGAGDIAGMTDGRFKLFNRGGVYCSIDLAAFVWGAYDLGAPAAYEYRDIITTAARTQFLTP